MSKTHFFEKCVILGELWVEFREQAKENEAWDYFFSYNDVALPMAYLIAEDYVEPTGNALAETTVEETWLMFCEYIDIDSEGQYGNLAEAFEASPNAPLPS
jgi:hypothetical protein